MLAPMPCCLIEPDGRRLTAGLCYRDQLAARGVLRVTALDRPGSLIRRCLLDAVRQVVLELADGQQLAAVIEEITFDPVAGRVCLLRVAPSPTVHGEEEQRAAAIPAGDNAVSIS